MTQFKPLLAVQAEFDKVDFRDMWLSPKLDGVRAIVIGGVVMSRNLKPIPNRHVQSLFKHLESLHALGRPLLVGVSRKSMIGQALNRPVGERLYGGLALAALAVTKGARILRVHDVAETVDLVRMIAAVESAE